MVHDNRNLDKYIELCGSRYSATAYVGFLARKLAEKYENVITHAEALSWILSGVEPEPIRDYSERIERRSQRSLRLAHNYLSNIHDDAVKESVLSSLKKSKEVGHLIYRYQDVYDRNRQARVRILSRILWDKMHDPDVEDT